jgi:SAM-dependent methyltransferase
MDERFEWALERLTQIHRESSIETVYDIGAGAEQMRQKVESLGLKYTAFDIFPRNDKVAKWDVELPCPFRTISDVVILLEVVEHLNNPWLGLRNIVAAIKPGGFLILSTPNPGWSESRLWLLRKGVLTMFTQEDLDTNHHVFTPWKHVILRLLSDNGLKLVCASPIGAKTKLLASPFWGWKMPFRVAYRATKMTLERTDQSSVGALYGVVAKKR